MIGNVCITIFLLSITSTKRSVIGIIPYTFDVLLVVIMTKEKCGKLGGYYCWGRLGANGSQDAVPAGALRGVTAKIAARDF